MIWMLPFLAPLISPAEPFAGHLRRAVKVDLEHNVAIGTGAQNAVLWYQAAVENDKEKWVDVTGCSKGSVTYRCAFTLFREGGDVRFEGKMSPATLRCTALFKRFTDAEGEEWAKWAVTHAKARPTGGHSRTSMHCWSGGRPPL